VIGYRGERGERQSEGSKGVGYHVSTDMLLGLREEKPWGGGKAYNKILGTENENKGTSPARCSTTGSESAFIRKRTKNKGEEKIGGCHLKKMGLQRGLFSPLGPWEKLWAASKLRLLQGQL